MVTEGKKNPFKGRQFTAEIVLWAVRWYLQFPISYRDLECMLSDRGVQVDHTTLFRWIQAYAPEIEKRIRPHLRMTNGSWGVDETYLRVKGEWVYLYRAVDASGQTIDLLLSPKRDAAAAGPRSSDSWGLGDLSRYRRQAVCITSIRRGERSFTSRTSHERIAVESLTAAKCSFVPSISALPRASAHKSWCSDPLRMPRRPRTQAATDGLHRHALSRHPKPSRS